MIDYDGEALAYDTTRGGEPRAQAAADALEQLLPQGRATVLDIACGTGIVTRRLLRPGRTVLGVDRSPGMLVPAGRRIPGGAVCGDATRLPFASGSVDAVVMVWLLHLLPDPDAVLAEALRVLRPGGRLVTTVDKEAAYFTEDGDLARATAELRRQYAPHAPDRTGRILDWAADHGLRPVGEARFPGTGQGRGARQWREAIEAGRIPWCVRADAGQVAEVVRRLTALPDQDTPIADPQYRLLALEVFGPPAP
ncbi:class I SAM-dependent methyltransferase [Kitasatospora purpeofusca]|uniref:class I SAM-dependent methyltransferase n=1 Tax=Kitasatospora purpeofusca TaxID=67352 RepID=UPI002A5ABC82|nr:methyltransferase domain-containing protein [Kitasatospora purpeofusca]MDY0816634.1 methyltransferase domain-containing protein [Kitasatospora purpeofusca]